MTTHEYTAYVQWAYSGVDDAVQVDVQIVILQLEGRGLPAGQQHQRLSCVPTDHLLSSKLVPITQPRVNFGTPMLAGQGNKTTRQVGCTNKRSNTHPLDTLKKDAGTRQKRTLLSIFAQESSKFGHLAELQHLHIKTLCRYDMMWYSCYGTLRRAS